MIYDAIGLFVTTVFTASVAVLGLATPSWSLAMALLVGLVMMGISAYRILTHE